MTQQSALLVRPQTPGTREFLAEMSQLLQSTGWRVELHSFMQRTYLLFSPKGLQFGDAKSEDQIRELAKIFATQAAKI